MHDSHLIQDHDVPEGLILLVMITIPALSFLAQCISIVQHHAISGEENASPSEHPLQSILSLAASHGDVVYPKHIKAESPAGLPRSVQAQSHQLSAAEDCKVDPFQAVPVGVLDLKEVEGYLALEP